MGCELLTGVEGSTRVLCGRLAEKAGEGEESIIDPIEIRGVVMSREGRACHGMTMTARTSLVTWGQWEKKFPMTPLD
jgi:hypothetical protein